MNGNARASERPVRGPGSPGGVQPGSTNRRFVVAVTAWSVVALISFLGIHSAGPAADAETPVADTGFTQPFAGPEEYLPFADSELTAASQFHTSIGLARANEIAAGIGLSADDAFTPQQYQDFITGQGVGGDPAQAGSSTRALRFSPTRLGARCHP